MSESVASEVVSAMVGGMFSASALYPLEVLKTRMQAETKATASSADGEDPEEVLPNEQEGEGGNASNVDSTESATNSSPAKERQLALKRKYATAASEGMGSYATLMYENEGGVSPFYAGVVTSAVQSATEKALYFFAYTFFKNG